MNNHKSRKICNPQKEHPTVFMCVYKTMFSYMYIRVYICTYTGTQATTDSLADIGPRILKGNNVYNIMVSSSCIHMYSS